MARFLDRIVSGLIKSSTGFNARPFVRMVGGKNLLLIGGAAIAGLAASEKMQTSDQRDAQAKGPAGGGGASPPPIPGSVPPPPPLPNVPDAEGVAEEADLPKSLVFAIVRTMVAAALSDGTMSAEERAMVQTHLGESGLAPDQVQQIQKELLIPAQPGEIVAGMDSPEDREMVYRFGALVTASDNALAESEKVWLASLAEALSLSPARAAQIQAEVFTT